MTQHIATWTDGDQPKGGFRACLVCVLRGHSWRLVWPPMCACTRCGKTAPNDFIRMAARLYDVPPWIISDIPRPRFAKLRWRLRHIFPRLVW
jgi:hypothetical protein